MYSFTYLGTLSNQRARVVCDLSLLFICQKMFESDDAVKRKLIPFFGRLFIKNIIQCHVTDQFFKIFKHDHGKTDQQLHQKFPRYPKTGICVIEILTNDSHAKCQSNIFVFGCAM